MDADIMGISGFGAVCSCVAGKLRVEGRGVTQDFGLAIRYLSAASSQGHWGRTVRAGFDR